MTYTELLGRNGREKRNTNEPPCPLTLALFEAEIAERMAQRAE
jgi:hypothetical protein